MRVSTFRCLDANVREFVCLPGDLLLLDPGHLPGQDPTVGQPGEGGLFELQEDLGLRPIPRLLEVGDSPLLDLPETDLLRPGLVEVDHPLTAGPEPREVASIAIEVGRRRFAPPDAVP